MKNLLAVCTTVLRAARLEYGGKSAKRHALKRLPISHQTIARKAGSAVLAAVLAVGMVGAAVVVPAASASTVISDQNQPSYWQALYPGSACTKPVGDLAVSTYTLPALPSGTDYVAVIVKAGSPNSVDVFNNVFDATSNNMPFPGDVVTTSTGKTISHIIICTITPIMPTVVVPVGPTVVQAPTCGGYGTVTAVETTGVSYVVTFDKKTGVWTVTATPASSAYTFDGESQTVTFTGNAGAYTECPIMPTVVPTAVSRTITCEADGSYTLGLVEGVIYTVNDTVQQPGAYSVSDTSTVKVKATAMSGFALKPDAKSEWTFTFVKPTGCGDLPTFALVTPAATHVDRTCTADGSYTLTAVVGISYAVNGKAQDAGTYPVLTAKTIDVVASTVSSEFGIEEGAPSSWNFVFTEPSNCGQLTTLALPGSNGTLAFTGSNGTLAGGLLLGVIFMMFGAGALTVSRVRRRTN